MNTGLPGLVYLIAVAWAISQSSKRWMTLLWTVVSLAVTIGVFFVLSLVWPDRAEVLGHLAVVSSLLISALVAINHMRAHRRVAAPKS